MQQQFEWLLPKQQANMTTTTGWCKPPSVPTCMTSKGLLCAQCFVGNEQCFTAEKVFGSSLPIRASCCSNSLCKALSSSSLRAGISASSFSLLSWAMLRQPESVPSHSHTNAFRSAGRLSSLPCTTYSSTWQLQRGSCWGRSRTLHLLLALGKGFWGIAETEFPFRTKFGSSPVTLAKGPARPRAGTYLTCGSPGSSLERLRSSTMNSCQMNVLCHGAVTFFLRLLHIAFLRKKSRILK